MESCMTKNFCHLIFGVLLLLSAVLWWRSLIADWRLAVSSDAHTYVLLILPISITLIYLKRDELRDHPERGRLWGAVPVAVALSVRFLSGFSTWQLSSTNGLSLSMGALVLFWIGSAIVAFGIGVLKINPFPICFLFLLVPLPEHAVVWITSLLERESAWASYILFRIAGVPVARDGVLLHIPGLNIEVAKECSSIRSSTMVVVTTLLLAHLFLKSWWPKLLLVVTSLPISVAKNALRIFVIAELGTRVDRGYLNGWLHHQGGFIYLGIAILFEILLLWILRSTETAQSDSMSRPE